VTGTQLPAARRLIVNADDLGQSASVNRGVFEAVDRGIVTSASLMVRWPAADDAVKGVRRRPAMSLGLHVDLVEWAVRDGAWTELYQVVDPSDEGEVADELGRQIDTFVRLVGRTPTHLDSHQHVHREDPVRTLMLRAANRLRVPLRDESDAVRHCGSFYGQYGAGKPYPEGISVSSLLEVLDGLGVGTTELGCHPGRGTFDDLETMYASERDTERATLCDPRVRLGLVERQIELCSFGDIT